MPISLHNRFQGTLMGAALGLQMGRFVQAQPRFVAPLMLRSPDAILMSSEPDPLSVEQEWAIPALKMAHLLMHSSLGQSNVNRLNPDSSAMSSQPSLAALEKLADVADVADLTQAVSGSSDDLDLRAIALLPLAIFFHEDREILQRRIQQLAIAWQIPNADQCSLEVIVHTIALAMQGQPIAQIMPSLQAHSSAWSQDTNAKRLVQIDQLVSQQVDLAIVAASLLNRMSSSMPPARSESNPSDHLQGLHCWLALYGFLSIPQAPQFALYRIAHMLHRAGKPHVIPMTCMLLGAMLGAHHGCAGLPINWRGAIAPSREAQMPLKFPHLSPTLIQFLNLADPLFLAWVGILDPDLSSALDTSLVSLAVVGPRNLLD